MKKLLIITVALIVVSAAAECAQQSDSTKSMYGAGSFHPNAAKHSLRSGPYIDSAAVEADTSIEKSRILSGLDAQMEECERALQGSYTRRQRALIDQIKEYATQMATLDALSGESVKFKKERIK